MILLIIKDVIILFPYNTTYNPASPSAYGQPYQAVQRQEPVQARQMSQNQPNILSQINQIKNMMAGKNPDAMLNDMYRSNPQFKEFVDRNRGKTVQQIAQEYGINPELINMK